MTEETYCRTCGAGPWVHPGKRRALVPYQKSTYCSACLPEATRKGAATKRYLRRAGSALAVSSNSPPPNGAQILAVDFSNLTEEQTAKVALLALCELKEQDAIATILDWADRESMLEELLEHVEERLDLDEGGDDDD